MTSSMHKTYFLKDICLKIGSGSTPRGGSNVYIDSGISFIRSQNIYNNDFEYNGLVHINNEAALKLKNVEVLKNDILLNITGDSVARCTIVPSSILPARVNQHVCIIRANSEIVDYRYLKYFFVNPYMQNKMLSLAQGGGTRAALTKKMIEDFEIKLPSLEEQIRISNVLSSLDKKIQLNNEVNTTLEEMAQTLFKRWFVDFEFPNEEGKPYKSSGGEMIESDMGMIPTGWKVDELESTASEIITGKTPSTKVKENYIGNIPFVTIPDMHDNVYIIQTERNLNEKAVNKNKILKKNSLIVSCIATPGLVSLASEQCQTNQQINSIIFEDDKICYYMYYTLKSLSEYIRMLGSSGSTTLNLNKTQFSKIKIKIPCKSAIDKYYLIVNSLFERILLNQKQNVNLNNIRNSLLPKLMNGEIRVDEIKANL